MTELQKRMLRRIFGPKSEEVTGVERGPHTKKIRNKMLFF